MKSLLYKLIFLTVILSGWIVYDRWEMVSSFFQSTTNKISTQAAKILSSDNPDKVTTTTVYKWKNKKGEWQFSNTKPKSVPDAEIQLFRSDENVIPSVPATSSLDNNSLDSSSDNKEKKSDGVFESIKGKINEVTELKKTLETPKTLPAE